MIGITDDLLDAAETAYVDALDLGVTNKHIATKILEAVIPLIAAAEREECARIAERRLSDTLAVTAEALAGTDYMRGMTDTSEAIARAIRARGASCA